LSSVQSVPSRAALAQSNVTQAKGVVEPLVVPRRGWREILAITIAVPLGVLCIHPADPFLVHADFPWLLLVPLLLGAQHGALGAATSAALLFATAWAYESNVGRLEVGVLVAWGSGCLAAGVIAGQFRDRIAARITQLSRQVEDDAVRLTRLSRAHAVVKLSHQKLEERLSAQGWSLESAIEDTRKELAASASLPMLCESMLNVVSNHAMVQTASLYTVVSGTRAEGPHLEFALAAKLGSPPSVDLEQRLIQRAITTGRLVALDVESAETGSDESVLAAVPLLGADGSLLGVIVIFEMPFMAFQAENLKSLAAVSAHLADVLEERLRPTASPSPLLQLVSGPDVPPVANEFVGTRTGTHRRRGLVQSA